MHVLALLVEIAAFAAPLLGIALELGREIGNDDDDRGTRQGSLAPVAAAA